MDEYMLKVRRYRICNVKEDKLFHFFFKMANTPQKGKPRHITWLSSFLFKIQYFYRDEYDLASDDKYYIKAKVIQ